jgi:phosphatidylserine/phosphatidylglycerophosphate/cardiolipin synthase-like enzyme
MGFRRARAFFIVLGVVLSGAVACGTTTQTSSPDGGTNDADASPTDTDSGATDATVDAAKVPVVPVCDETAARTPAAQVLVMPDAGETPFVNAIGKATTSLHVLIYELGSGGILTALEAKAQAGLDVRVIFAVSEQSYDQKAYDALSSAGAKVLWSDPKFTYMHAKTIVIDAREAIISTGNFTAGQMKSERNYAVIDDDPADVASLGSIFDADFARMTPDLSCTRLLVSPVNSKPRILTFIKSATKSLAVESMEFQDSDVRAAVLARAKAGVDVRVLLADTTFVTENASAQTFLTQAGIPGRTLHTPTIHVKSIIVDGTRAYLGSENLSYTSLTQNREVGVEVSQDHGEDVASMVATFEKDWAVAVPNPPVPDAGGGGTDAGDDASDDGGATDDAGAVDDAGDAGM